MTSQELGASDATSLPEEIELKNFIGYANRLQAAIKVWKNKAKEAVNNARWLGEEVVRLEERCEAADGEIAYIRSALKEILDSEPVDLKHRRAKQLAAAKSKRPSSITYSAPNEARQNVKPELANNSGEASAEVATERSNEGAGETSRPAEGSVDQSGGLSALRQNYRESTPDDHGQERRNEQVSTTAQVNGIVRRDSNIGASSEPQRIVYGPIDPTKQPLNCVVKAPEEQAASAVVEAQASSGNQTTDSHSRSRTSSRHNSNVKSELRGRPKQHEGVKRKMEVSAEGQSKRRRLTTSSEVTAGSLYKILTDKDEQQHDEQPEEDLLGAFKKSNDNGRSDVYAEVIKQEEKVSVQSAQPSSQGWTMKIESDVQAKRDVKLSPQSSPPLRGILKIRGRSNPPPPLPPKNEGKFGEAKNRRAILTPQPPPPPLIKPSPPSATASARPSNFIGPVIPEDLKKQSIAIVGQPKLSVPVKTTSMESNSAQEANSPSTVAASPVAGPYGTNNQAQQSPVVQQQQSQPPMTPNPTEVMLAPQAYPMITNQYPACSTPQLQTVYYQLPNQHVPVPGPPLPHQGVPLPPPNQHQGNINNGMNSDVAPPTGGFNNNVQPNNFSGPPPTFPGGQQGGFSNPPPGPQRPGSAPPNWINDYPQRVQKIENIFKNRFVCYSFCINGRCSCQFTNPQAHPQELAGRFGPSFDDQPALPPDVIHRIWTRLPERFKKTNAPGGAQREYKCRICRVSIIGYFNFNKHLNESGHRNSL